MITLMPINVTLMPISVTITQKNPYLQSFQILEIS